MFQKCKKIVANLLPKKPKPNFEPTTDYNKLLQTPLSGITNGRTERKALKPLTSINLIQPDKLSYDTINPSLYIRDIKPKTPDVDYLISNIGNIKPNTNRLNFNNISSNLLDRLSTLDTTDYIYTTTGDSPIFALNNFRSSTIDKSRLQIEKKIVGAELPQFILIKSGKTPCFVGDYCSTATNDRFTLRLELPDYYPDQMPNLFITYPITLRKSGGGRISDMGISHNYHTLGTGPGGCIQICHFNGDSWDASRTCVAVLLKGIIWLEAYCVSLLTNLTIAEIIDQWGRRQ